MPSGQHKITGLPFDTHLYSSENKIKNPELKVCIVVEKIETISAALNITSPVLL